MAHIALYRSWRPQTFADVVGQAHVVRTLQNALKENRLSHAYLFNGPRGTGKTTLARLLAKAVNCERGPAAEPCNECDACRRITEGSVIDVLEIDAASNRGVDEIRDLRDKTKYSPTEVRRKVYIIDEVHMLTTEAFNALLKTLEEPPEHVMFILATTEPHKLPATIISRCQRFDFRRVSAEEQTDWLERICRGEGFEADRDALQYIAKLSEGGMRDAVSLLDQISSFSEEKITYEAVVSITGGVTSEQFGHLARAVLERDVGRCLELVEAMSQEGKSADKCMESLMVYFRDLLMIRMVPKSEAVTDRILHVEEFRKVAEGFPSDELFRVIETLNHYQTEMKYSAQPQTLFEVALMKLCTAPAAAAPSQGEAQASPAGRDEIRELSRKVALLEQQLSKLRQAGAAAVAESPSGQAPAASIVSPPSRGASSAGSSGGVRKRIKLEPYLQSRGSDLLKQVVLKWSQVLAMVKERKITVHAWLIDGEPVGYDEDTVLLAFKSSMHRETTEKPANKQLIEQAVSEILGHPVRLATVMMKEWKEADAEAKEAPPPEILQLEPEDPSGEAEWVSEALRLFGPELVKIKEE